MRRHRSVKIVRVVTGEEPEGHQELLTFLGYPHATPLFWSADDNLKYFGEEKSLKGGVVKAAKPDGDDKVWTFVLVRCLEESSAAAKACVLIAALMHEMGHVDDIERGKILRFDTPVDLVAAEEYAHRYAYKRMMRENIRFPLGVLLASILNDSREAEDDTVRRAAALRVVGSGEYGQFRRFVGDLVDVEACATTAAALP